MPGQGTVVSLQLCLGNRQPMSPVTSAHAIENLGLEGDRHAKRDSQRQVLLIEAETLDKLNLRIGEVRENITTRGIDLMKLPIGTRLSTQAEAWASEGASTFTAPYMSRRLAGRCARR